jgi:hypothetical protein
MLTENKATNTEEAVHRIQPPSYYFLQVWRNFANQKIECPVCGSGEGDTFRTDGERKDLRFVSFLRLREKQSRKEIPLGDTTTESDPS